MTFPSSYFIITYTIQAFAFSIFSSGLNPYVFKYSFHINFEHTVIRDLGGVGIVEIYELHEIHEHLYVSIPVNSAL